MSQTNDFSTMEGIFKQRYAPKIGRLTPKCGILSKLIKLDNRALLGDMYNYPVYLTNEWGATAAQGQAGMVPLNSSISAQSKNARIDGNSMYITSTVAYDAAAAASNGDMASFDTIVGNTVVNMKTNAVRLLEFQLLYGSSGLATSSHSVNIGATSTTITVDTASFAAGIWSNLQNAKVQFYNGASLISSGVDSIFTVTSVNTSAKTAVITGTATGITALDTALTTLTLDVYLNGFYGNEMAGLKKIMTNSGTLFNIDASVYDLWRANVYPVSGQLVRADLNAAIETAAGRGLDQDVVVLVNPMTYGTLNTTESGSRVYQAADVGGKTGVNGFERIEYFSSTGKMAIIPHPFVKQGDAFVLPVPTAKRIGSTDWTFNINGAPNGPFFLHIPGYTGYEMRIMSNQALILEAPAKTVYISGITN